MSTNQISRAGTRCCVVMLRPRQKNLSEKERQHKQLHIHPSSLNHCTHTYTHNTCTDRTQCSHLHIHTHVGTDAQSCAYSQTTHNRRIHTDTHIHADTCARPLYTHTRGHRRTELRIQTDNAQCGACTQTHASMQIHAHAHTHID